MNLLLKYLTLCAFKNNPLDFVPKKVFRRNVIIFYFLSGWLVEGLIADPTDGFLEVSLRMIMAFSTISVFLFFTKKWMYFNQLFTSIFVCENLIMTLATACEALDFYLAVTHAVYREEIGMFLATLLVVWYLLIVAYILRKFYTFDVKSSIILAFTYFVLTYGIPMLFMDI